MMAHHADDDAEGMQHATTSFEFATIPTCIANVIVELNAKHDDPETTTMPTRPPSAVLGTSIWIGIDCCCCC